MALSPQNNDDDESNDPTTDFLKSALQMLIFDAVGLQIRLSDTE